MLLAWRSTLLSHSPAAVVQCCNSSAAVVHVIVWLAQQFVATIRVSCTCYCEYNTTEVHNSVGIEGVCIHISTNDSMVTALNTQQQH
jgi:hypothetical protein